MSLLSRIDVQQRCEARFGRFGVRGSVRQRMVDAAIDALELREIEEPAFGKPHAFAAFHAKNVANAGAKTESIGLIGFIAFQIFKAFIVQIIVDWWLDRDEN